MCLTVEATYPWNYTDQGFTVDSHPGIDEKERVLDKENLDDSYTKSTLGTAQKLQAMEQKILGVHWSVSADMILFDVWDIAEGAKKVKPTRRNIVDIVGALTRLCTYRQ